MTRSRRRLTSLVALLAVFAIIGAACGGGGDETSDATDGGGPAEEAGEDAATTDTDAQDAIDEEAAARQEAEAQQALAEAQCPVNALDEATGPVEITMWHAMNASLEDTIIALTDEYNATQDRVVVSLVNQSTYATNFDTFRNASAGDRPNIVQLEETAVQAMIDSQTALPVQACADAAGYSFDDHIDRVMAAFTVGDVVWPMPFNSSNPVLWYDRGAFAEAGLDPDAPPTTLAELREASRVLVESGAATGGFAFATGGMPWMVEQILGKADVAYANNGNGRAGLATEVVFNTPEMVEVVTFFRDLETDGLAVNTGANPDATANFFAFLGETPVAMTIETSAALSSVLDQLPVLAPDLEIGVAPLPGLTSPDPGGALVGGAALWLTEDKPDEEIAAAWDFVRWLNEPEQQATWHLGSGYLPIRESTAALPEVVAAWEEQPAFRVPFDQLLEGNETVASSGPVMGPHTLIRDELELGFERVLLEGLDPATMIDDLEETANELLVDYARRTGR
ncbi:MAG: ABC transporter substrate-binding protein [Acidimicrobiales bacterium]